jgi:hypothetical protein
MQLDCIKPLPEATRIATFLAMRPTPWILATLASCFLGCSGTVTDQIAPGTTAPTSASSNGEVGTKPDDGAVMDSDKPKEPSDPPPTPGPDPAPSCDRTLGNLQLTQALLGVSAGKKVWLLRGQDGDAIVSITIREGSAKAGEKGSFGAEQMQPTTAPIRLQIQTQCEAHDDHFHCGPNYVAQSGEWSVSELGERVGDSFLLSLSANAKEARVRGSSVTLLANGKSICLAQTKLSGVLSAP